ncbi:MAG: leucine-rich repeat protein, partial [Lachnospiraceae bacterium]|nr:leucine-rich repeat protein [Lachnospiraceae bacterium]
MSVDIDNPKYDSRDNCNAIIETSSNQLIVGCKNTIIPNTVTTIGTYAFSNCKSLTSIT